MFPPNLTESDLLHRVRMGHANNAAVFASSHLNDDLVAPLNIFSSP